MNIVKKLSFFTLLKGFALSFTVFATLYPFIHMLAVSFSKGIYVMQNKITVIPKGFTFLVYKYVFADNRIYTAYANTILLVLIGTAVSLAVTATAAYSMSRKEMVFRRFFILLLVIPMFFEGGIIPMFLTVKDYGLYNSMWAIILPYTVNIWNLFIMRSFYAGIPEELHEAGRIDGMKDIGIFFRIIMPLSKPVLAAIGLFYAVAYWNTYFAPLIYLSSPKKYPLQLVLRQILLSGENFNNDIAAAGSLVADQSLKYATIIVATLPILMIYPFMQKYFMKGIMIGSVKG